MSNKAKIYVYKEGNECSSITGGWYSKRASVTNSNNELVFETSSTIYRASCATNRTFDLTKFSDIYVDIKYATLTSSTTIPDLRFCTDSQQHRENGAIVGDYVELIRITNQTTGITKSFQGLAKIDIVNAGNYYMGFKKNATSTATKAKVQINSIYMNSKIDVINILNQDNNLLEVTFNNLDNLISIAQVDILANSRIIQSYTENLDSITYTFDDSLMDWGRNEISIRAIYTQGDNIYEIAELISDIPYKKEVVLEEFDPVGHLPSNANMRDIVNRISLIGSINNAIKNNLKNLLESKGFEVGDTPRLSNMVKLVNELSNNNSTEITEYINRITELESEVANNKILLYNKLIDIGINCSQDTNFADLVNKLDEISTKDVYLYVNGEDLVGFNTAFNNGYSSDILVKYTNYMQSSNPNTNSWIARSTDAVVSTVGMNYLCIEYELAVSPSLNLDNAVDLYPVKPTSWSGLVNGAKSLFYRVTSGQTTGIYSAFVDISDVNGTYSVCIRTSWGGIRIRKIWMRR